MSNFNFIQGKKVCITGAAGSIGSALARRIARLKPKRLIILDCDESGLFEVWEEVKTLCNTEIVIANIRERYRIQEVFKKYSPNIVYHAAAYKHVVLMEMFQDEAFKTNVLGTKNVLLAARDFGVKKVVFISTDKAVNPVSYLGETKEIGEKFCFQLERKQMECIVVRFGNVMASRGSVIPIWNKQIAENRNLTLTDIRMKRYFMGIYDAVDLVIKASEIGKHGDVIVLDMGEPMPVINLARMMIKFSGKPLDVETTKVGRGERFFEELMTKYEKKRAIKKDGLYIIHAR